MLDLGYSLCVFKHTIELASISLSIFFFKVAKNFPLKAFPLNRLQPCRTAEFCLLVGSVYMMNLLLSPTQNLLELEIIFLECKQSSQQNSPGSRRTESRKGAGFMAWI